MYWGWLKALKHKVKYENRKNMNIVPQFIWLCMVRRTSIYTYIYLKMKSAKISKNQLVGIFLEVEWLQRKKFPDCPCVFEFQATNERNEMEREREREREEEEQSQFGKLTLQGTKY